MQEYILNTPYGKLFTAASKPTDTDLRRNSTILFLHGNSSSSAIFSPLYTNTILRSNYPMIIFDLPGHGKSTDAPDPEESYTQSGYAAAAADVLKHYDVKEVIVLGWSLGGHNAIELIPRLKFHDSAAGIKLLGIMIVGTPPSLGLEQVSAAFKGEVHMGMAATNVLSAEQCKDFADVMTKVHPAPDWLRETVVRTDGRAREIMFKAFVDGKGADQIKVLEHWKDGWVAIVNGGAEPFVDLDYCDEVGKRTARLWEAKCHRLGTLEHAPFFEDPDAFEPVFMRFIEDCCKLRS